jgi:hypothetical protein
LRFPTARGQLPCHKCKSTVFQVRANCTSLFLNELERLEDAPTRVDYDFLSL